MRVYFDSSAIVKSLVIEDNSDDIVEYMASLADGGNAMITLVISVAEVRRILLYKGIDEAELTGLFDDFELIGLDVGLCESASRIKNPRSAGTDYIKTLDALHIQAAINGVADTFVSYDELQGLSASSMGLDVFSPGRTLRTEQ